MSQADDWQADDWTSLQIGTAASFSFDVGRLDHGPPLLDLRLRQGAEPIGHLLFARETPLSESREAPTHGRIGQGIDGRGIEPGDHVLWRALRRPKPMPIRKVDPG